MFCARDESGGSHAFNHQMCKMRHDEAVLDGSGLAFIGVADDIFFGDRLLSNEVPLHRSWEARSTHAAQFGLFQFRENAIPVLAGDELTKNAIFFSSGIGIGSAPDALGLRMVFP